MKPPRRLPFVALLLLAVSCAGSPPPARVAGNEVTDQELATTAAVFQSFFDIQGAPCTPSAETTANENEPPEASCNRLALGELVQFELAESYAAAHDVTVTDAVVKDTSDRIIANLADGALDQALASNEVTRADFEEVLRRSLLREEVARALVVASVGEEGLRQRYEESLGDYTIVQVDHILVATEAEARRIREQVTAPGFTERDFQALASQVSQDPSAPTNGGALGSAYASTYTAAFRDAVLTMAPGQISEPVQSEFGWHVIWMIDKQVTPFDEARTKLLDAEKASAFADLVREAVAGGEVQVDPRFGRFDPASLQVLAVRSTDPSDASSPAPVNATPAG